MPPPCHVRMPRQACMCSLVLRPRPASHRYTLFRSASDRKLGRAWEQGYCMCTCAKHHAVKMAMLESSPSSVRLKTLLARFLLGTGRMPHPVCGAMGVALCTAVKRGYPSLLPRPPPFFCSSVCVLYNTRKRKSALFRFRILY